MNIKYAVGSYVSVFGHLLLCTGRKRYQVNQNAVPSEKPKCHPAFYKSCLVVYFPTCCEYQPYSLLLDDCVLQAVHEKVQAQHCSFICILIEHSVKLSYFNAAWFIPSCWTIYWNIESSNACHGWKSFQDLSSIYAPYPTLPKWVH